MERELDAAGLSCTFIDPRFEPGSRSQFEAANSLGLRFSEAKASLANLDQRVNVNPNYGKKQAGGGISLTQTALKAIMGYHHGEVMDGAIGCALSHAIALQQAASKREGCNTLILESDAHLTEGFMEKATAAMESVNSTPRWDILMLGFKELGAVVQPEHVGSACRAGYCWMTTGYVVTPAGAKKIVETMLQAAIIPEIDDILPAMAWGSPILDIDEEFGPANRIHDGQQVGADRQPLLVYRSRNPLVVEHQVHGKISNTCNGK